MTERTGTDGATCPGCGAEMLPLQRFGVGIRKCTGCAGLFMTEADLARLATAQAEFSTPPPQYRDPYPAYPPQTQGGGMLGGFFGGGHGGRRGHH